MMRVMITGLAVIAVVAASPSCCSRELLRTIYRPEPPRVTRFDCDARHGSVRVSVQFEKEQG